MDTNDKRQETTIETLPGFKPLTVVPWRSGYGSDVLCDGITIGQVDETFHEQYKSTIADHFALRPGRGAAYQYHTNHDDAVQFIRDRWVAFIGELIVGGGPVWVACKIAGKVG